MVWIGLAGMRGRRWEEGCFRTRGTANALMRSEQCCGIAGGGVAFVDGRVGW